MNCTGFSHLFLCLCDELFLCLFDKLLQATEREMLELMAAESKEDPPEEQQDPNDKNSVTAVEGTHENPIVVAPSSHQ